MTAANPFEERIRVLAAANPDMSLTEAIAIIDAEVMLDALASPPNPDDLDAMTSYLRGRPAVMSQVEEHVRDASHRALLVAIREARICTTASLSQAKRAVEVLVQEVEDRGGPIY